MGVAGPGWWGCGAQKILLSFGVRRSLSCLCGGALPRVRRFHRSPPCPARGSRTTLSGGTISTARLRPSRRSGTNPPRGGQSGRAWYCRRRDGARSTRRRGDRIRGGARGTRGGAGRRDRLGRRQCCGGRQCRRRRRLAAGALRHRLRAMHGRQRQSGRGPPGPGPVYAYPPPAYDYYDPSLVAARLPEEVDHASRVIAALGHSIEH